MNYVSKNNNANPTTDITNYVGKNNNANPTTDITNYVGKNLHLTAGISAM